MAAPLLSNKKYPRAAGSFIVRRPVCSLTGISLTDGGGKPILVIPYRHARISAHGCLMTHRFGIGILIVLVAFLSYLAYLVLAPFFRPITWAAVFAIVFYPVYDFILRRIGRQAPASLATVAIVLIVILGPLSYLSYLLVGELHDLATAGLTVEGVRSAYQNSPIHGLANRVLPVFHLDEQQALAYVAGALSNLSKELLRRAPGGWEVRPMP